MSAFRVNPTPLITKPTSLVSNFIALTTYLSQLVSSIIRELQLHAVVLNTAITSDGVNTMEKPLVLKSYTVATVPAAADWLAGTIYVSNETGGAVIAFSDGTNWRRVTDRAVIS